MGISAYVAGLRRRIGHDLLLLPSSTCLVFDDDRRVLLVEHSDTGRWVPPGGAVEPHETPADAAARELWEETGLVGRPIRVLGVFGGPGFELTYRNGDEVAYVTTLFECEVLGGELRPDSEEVLRFGWFGADELPAGLAPWAQQALPPVLAADNTTTCFTPSTWTPLSPNAAEGR